MGMIIGSITVEDDIFRVIIKYKLDGSIFMIKH